MNTSANAATQQASGIADEIGDEDVLRFDVADAALEAAAGAVGAIPTASIDIIPPNCC